MSGNQQYGQSTPTSGSGEYNTLEYVVGRILNRMATATLVKVKAVSGSYPNLRLDVQPMVNMLDGKGDATEHGTVHDIPAFTYQGGSGAVRIDPVVGDIGLCVFALSDISSVKANKAVSNPGSRRKFDWADGLYIGGFLNSAASAYIWLKANGDIELKPASKVIVTGDMEVSGKVTTGAGSEFNGIEFDSHRHGGVTTGGGNSTGPI